MLENQRHLFHLNDSITFLNAAYMSPQLKSVSELGLKQVVKKERPEQFGVTDFFEPRIELKRQFAQLIGAKEHKSIAIIPSASYGIASAAQNIRMERGDEIVVCEGQFPSHIYSWQQLAAQNGGRVVVVEAPSLIDNRAEKWNQRLLEAIHPKTKVVAIPHVHWADGTLFDLRAIRERSSDVGAKLIIDGTQSIGAFPFSLEEFGVDALICAGYKWLMGPYGIGVAYYNETFWDGNPIEHNWMNRHKSEDFANLTNYQSEFQPGAERFTMGGSSNFILTPMLTKAIEQVNAWGPGAVQEYCKRMNEKGIDQLRTKGCFVENEKGRAHHLLGVYLPSSMDKTQLMNRLKEEKVFVSFRGDAIRVSPHVYNKEEDLDRFIRCLG